MPRVAVGIEYLGTAYCGWQAQAGQRTVQQQVEAALSAVADEPVAVVCAGRTDTGVHALGQVVHFDTAAARAPRAWVLGANTRLPQDISLLWAQEVPSHFHARYSALSRSYRYVIVNRGQRPALAAGRVAWVHRPLDVASMRAAAAHLLGEHDFSAFRSADCQSKTPMRRITAIAVERSGERITIDVTANAFLHHMVRNLVGSLLPIGRGERPVSWLAELLDGRDRTVAGPTALPQGLLFIGPLYPRECGLPAEVTL